MALLAIGLLLACGHPRAGGDPATCARCHAAEAQAWSNSRHAAAFDNEVFQRSWSETRSPWCLSCHHRRGVSCGVCHGEGARDCASCHQFDLPTEIGGSPSGTPGQDTLGEWRRSTAGRQGRSCISCHDPHTAPGGHDRAWIRDALTAHVVAIEGGVRATVTAREVGHAVPTGDPFRRLVLTVCADLACDRPVARRILARRLIRDEAGRWVLDRDTRLPPPTEGYTTSKTLILPVDAVAWRLTSHLADPAHEQDLDATFLVASGLVLPVEIP